MSKIPSPEGYNLVEKLGSGSYATVYKGYHKVLLILIAFINISHDIENKILFNI